MSEDNPLRPAPPRKDEIAPRAPAEPQSDLLSFLQNRLESLESQLMEEKKRSNRLEQFHRDQSALRSEADLQLKSILDQLKSEKTEREQEAAKFHAQGRIDALEKRLDEMHQTWANLLREAVSNRDQEQPTLLEGDSKGSAEGIRSLTEMLQQAREEISEARRLQARLPDEIRQKASEIGRNLQDRLAEFEQRRSAESRKAEETATLLSRERALHSAAQEERHRQLQQEYSKERLELQKDLERQLGHFKTELDKSEPSRLKETEILLGLEKLLSRIQEKLNRPETASDQMIVDLEREKQELLKVLEARNISLRDFAAERQEVERSMGESLMDLTRQLEAARSKELAWQSKISELKVQVEAAERKEAVVQAMAAERDNLLQSLLDLTRKLQKAGADRAQSEHAWESKVGELRQALEDEKGFRQAAQRQTADLEARTKSMADHIALTLQDKEEFERQRLLWKEEREKLAAELRRKEELLALISSTFQSAFKK